MDPWTRRGRAALVIIVVVTAIAFIFWTIRARTGLSAGGTARGITVFAFIFWMR